MKEHNRFNQTLLNKYKIYCLTILILSIFIVSIGTTGQVAGQNLQTIYQIPTSKIDNSFLESPNYNLDAKNKMNVNSLTSESNNQDYKDIDFETLIDSSEIIIIGNKTYHQIQIQGSNPIIIGEDSFNLLKSLWKMGLHPQITEEGEIELNSLAIGDKVSSGFPYELYQAYPGFQTELKKYEEYLGSLWSPSNTSSMISMNETSSDTFYEDSIKNLVMGASFSNQYPSSNTYSINEFNDIKIIENETFNGDYQLSQKSIISSDINITESRSVVGPGKFEIKNLDTSFLSNISIPVKKSLEEAPKTIIEEKECILGFEIELPHFNWDQSITLVLVQLHGWAHFNVLFRMDFPVKFVIEYPSEVIQGQSFTVNVTLVPLDLKDFNEFQVDINIGIGISFDLPVLKSYQHYVDDYYFEWWPFGCWCWRYNGKKLVTDYYWAFAPAYTYGFNYDFHASQSYKTPLGGEIVNVDFPIQIPLYDNTFVSLALKVKDFNIVGGKVLANLKTTVDQPSSIWGMISNFIPIEKMYSWDSANQKQTMEINSDKTESATEISFTISTITYLVNKISFPVYLSIIPKNLWPLMFHDWIGDLDFPIGTVVLPDIPLPSSASYSISGPNLIPSADYTINMDIKEANSDLLQNSGVIFNPNDNLYTIDVSNPSGAADTALFSTSELPSGYKSEFFPRFVQLDSSGPKRVILVIHAPDTTTNPPGTNFFQVTATSKTLQDYQIEGASTTKSVQIFVPIYSSFVLSIDPGEYETVTVNPKSETQIQYWITNKGNFWDTYDINATLKTSNEIFTWTDVLSAASNKIDNGIFKFNYSRSGIYPRPGIYQLEIQATSAFSPLISKKYIILLNFTPTWDIETVTSSESITVGSNLKTKFILYITNLGNTLDNFTINLDGRPELIQFLKQPEKVINLLPDETYQVPIGIDITRPLDIPVGNYDLRITVLSDGSGITSKYSAKIVQIIMPAYDLIPPSIEFIGPSCSENCLVYPQSPFDLGPMWKAFDQNENYYWVYINDSLYFNNTWTNGTINFVPVTGTNSLKVGLYNITIVFSDGRNLAIDQKWIKIVPLDTYPPTILFNSPDFHLPVNFNKIYAIDWTIKEEFLRNITLLLDGNPLSESSSITIHRQYDNPDIFDIMTTLNPGKVPEGIFNYTLIVVDQGNNTISSSVIVTIGTPDFTPPDLTMYPVSQAYQNRGNAFLFMANDLNPDNYQFYVNSELLVNTTWSSMTAIYFDPDILGLSLGTHFAELYVYDKSGWYTIYTWYLTINDIDKPTLLNTPISTLAESMISVTNAPVWEVFDRNPGNYSIYRDGELVETGIWTLANATIRAPLDNIDLGIHKFQVMITDTSGNTLLQTLDLSILDNEKPLIISQNMIFVEPSFGANWFELFIIENHPKTYELLQNGSVIQSKPITSEFPYVLADLNGIKPGIYNYTLVVNDTSENSGMKSVLVRIADFTPPRIEQVSDLIIGEDSVGNMITWTVNELFPQSYSIFIDNNLYLSNNYTDSNIPITLGLDDFTLDVYQITLVVEDQSGFSHTTQSYVTVVDITRPKISHISDCIILSGDSNAILSWNVIEKHPASYEIYKDGVKIKETKWTGQNIDFQVTGWPVGTYEILLNVTDLSGNSASDIVSISLVSLEPTITNSAQIRSSPAFEFIIALSSFLACVIVIRYKKRCK